MEEKGAAKCKVCGRKLRNPISIARGIGPVCAGDKAGGRTLRVKMRHPSPHIAGSNNSLPIQMIPQIMVDAPAQDKLYRLVTLPLTRGQFRAELMSMKRGTKKKLRRLRAEMLLARKTFCAGAFFLNGEQCVYEPVGETSWRELHSPRVVESLSLKTYLTQIGVITTERKGAAQ